MNSRKFLAFAICMVMVIPVLGVVMTGMHDHDVVADDENELPAGGNGSSNPPSGDSDSSNSGGETTVPENPSSGDGGSNSQGGNTDSGNSGNGNSGSGGSSASTCKNGHHTWVSMGEVSECPANAKQYCSVCGIVEGTGLHYWTEKSRTASNCATNVHGEINYSCNKCGETKIEILPIKHTASQTTTQEATCKAGQTKVTKCLNCGATIGTEVLGGPVDHSYNSSHFCRWCGALDPNYGSGQGSSSSTPSTPSHKHTYVVRYDSSSHWDECTSCGDKTNVAKHTMIITSDLTCHYHRCGCGYADSPTSHTPSGNNPCASVLTCAVCKANYPGGGSHNYGSWYYVDSGRHAQKCATCGDIKYDSHFGGEAKCGEAAVCGICGHSYGSASAHTGGTEVRGMVAATATTSGYTGDTYCLGCGKVISSGSTIPALGEDHKHSYASNHDSSTHWRECSCGSRTDVASHSYNSDGVCSCGATDPNHVDHHHYFSLTYAYDGSMHWRQCTVDGCTEVLSSPHVFKDGKCSCGYYDPNYTASGGSSSASQGSGGSSSGQGSSGGSSSDGPSIPGDSSSDDNSDSTPSEPVVPSNPTVMTDDDGIITDEEIDNFLATHPNADSITLDSTGQAGAMISSDALSSLVENDKTISVTNDAGTIYLSMDVIKNLLQVSSADPNGVTVFIAVSNPELIGTALYGVDLSAFAGGMTVHELNGTVTVTVPFIVSMDDPQNYGVWYVDENGDRTYMDSVVTDDGFMFTTDHFSTFVVDLAPEEESGSSMLIIIAAVIIVLIICAAVYFKSR